MKILVTGASGGLAVRVAQRLADAGHQLTGADPRGEGAGEYAFPGEVARVEYTQRRMADVFRGGRFDALLHLGRAPLNSGLKRGARYQQNVLGTRNLLGCAQRYGVKHVIVLSTFHVYGAHQHNHLYLTEEDPLRATQIFPELVDAVEMDNAATAFLLRHRELRTVVLRPTNIIGAGLRNQISTLLRSRMAPVLTGYDPMLQFVHALDVSRAIEAALGGTRGGVYNVAGEGVVPYTAALRLAGTRAVSIPHLLAYPLMGLGARVGLTLPKHLLDYFRYPTIISDEAFRRDFGYRPSVTTVEALRSVRR